MIRNPRKNRKKATSNNTTSTIKTRTRIIGSGVRARTGNVGAASPSPSTASSLSSIKSAASSSSSSRNQKKLKEWDRGPLDPLYVVDPFETIVSRKQYGKKRTTVPRPTKSLFDFDADFSALEQEQNQQQRQRQQRQQKKRLKRQQQHRQSIAKNILRISTNTNNNNGSPKKNGNNKLKLFMCTNNSNSTHRRQFVDEESHVSSPEEVEPILLGMDTNTDDRYLKQQQKQYEQQQRRNLRIPPVPVSHKEVVAQYRIDGCNKYNDKIANSQAIMDCTDTATAVVSNKIRSFLKLRKNKDTLKDDIVLIPDGGVQQKQKQEETKLTEEELANYKNSVMSAACQRLQTIRNNNIQAEEDLLVQKLFRYQKVADIARPKPNLSSSRSSNSINYNNAYNMHRTVSNCSSISSNSTSNNKTSARNNNIICARPKDIPTIKDAITGLPLIDFEKKAKERAKTIVSTWLFDVGIIDELLDNGGISSRHTIKHTTIRAGQQQQQQQAAATNNNDDNKSIRSSEGVELTSRGVPIEGSTKIDKEIIKLRSKIKRQLSTIDNHLSNGVTASKTEVQEVVNTIIMLEEGDQDVPPALADGSDSIPLTTNSKLEVPIQSKHGMKQIQQLHQSKNNSSLVASQQRLRELTTYISNTNDIDRANHDLLMKYPRLKDVANARQNFRTCVDQLDHFVHMPITCERLQEELIISADTPSFFAVVQNVCKEHIQMENFLIQIQRNLNEYCNYNHSAAIDAFLHDHIQSVHSLGQQIRVHILRGIKNSFYLTMNSPDTMIAITKVIETYEKANKNYKFRREPTTPTILIDRDEKEEISSIICGSRDTTSCSSSTQAVPFVQKDMRVAALRELYHEMEIQCLEDFRETTMQAADVADEEAFHQQFDAVLKAAKQLIKDDFVKTQMVQCFPEDYDIEILWCTCIARVSSQHILQQVGGEQGRRLPYLTVTQLIDLIEYIEDFRSFMEQIFQKENIGKINFGGSSIVCDIDESLRGLDLFSEKKKKFKNEIMNSVSWVYHTLWKVHDFAQTEFLLHTKEQTCEWLNNVYSADHPMNQTVEGRLITSLCEDVYALAGVQLRTIRDRLNSNSEALALAISVIFKHLYEKQISSRDMFLKDFEKCCAASNDFLRMTEKFEGVLKEVKEECSFPDNAALTLDEQSSALLDIYNHDAIYAAQKLQLYIFEPIEEAVGTELFGTKWLNDMTHNEFALTLIRTLDDFVEDLEQYMDEAMVGKAVESSITASILFYVRVLLRQSNKHKGKRGPYFTDSQKALHRMNGDIVIMRRYFEDLSKTMPSITPTIEREFVFLDTIYEIMAIAAGQSQSEAQDFILLIQKRVRNIHLTKFLVGDIWNLMNPSEEHDAYELVDSIEEEMTAVAPTDAEAMRMAIDRSAVPGLRLDQMVAKHVDEETRKRPLKASALAKVELILSEWRKTWVVQDEYAIYNI